MPEILSIEATPSKRVAFSLFYWLSIKEVTKNKNNGHIQEENVKVNRSMDRGSTIGFTIMKENKCTAEV